MTDTTQAILIERAKTHGDYGDHARITQGLKRILRAERKTLSDPHQEAIEMILHKIGRVIAGNADFNDHWDDIAGYAKLASDACRK